jgi:hypothetical protein
MNNIGRNVELGMPINFVWNFHFCVEKYQRLEGIKMWEYICQHSELELICYINGNFLHGDTVK